MANQAAWSTESEGNSASVPWHIIHNMTCTCTHEPSGEASPNTQTLSAAARAAVLYTIRFMTSLILQSAVLQMHLKAVQEQTCQQQPWLLLPESQYHRKMYMYIRYVQCTKQLLSGTQMQQAWDSIYMTAGFGLAVSLGSLGKPY